MRQKVRLSAYEEAGILIKRKAYAFFFALVALITVLCLYLLLQLLSHTPFSSDVKFSFAALLVLVLALAALNRGFYVLSTNTVLLVILLVSTLVVYKGETLDELKLYSMGFFHTIALILAVLVSKHKIQIFGVGLGSAAGLSLYFFLRLLPQAANGDLYFYFTSYTAVLVFIGAEIVIGIQTMALLNSSLEEIVSNLERDEASGLSNEKGLLDRAEKIAREGHSVFLIFYRIQNYNELLLSFGGDVLNSFVVTGTDVLAKQHDSEVFRIGEEIFCCLATQDKASVLKRKDSVMNHFKSHIASGDLEVKINLNAALVASEGRRKEMLRDINRGYLCLFQAEREKKSFIEFNREEENAWRHRLKLSQDLSKAIHRQEFIVFYQPLIDRKGDTIAYEALSRWNRGPGEPSVGPDVFIPMLEMSGLMNDFFLLHLKIVLRDIRNNAVLQGPQPIQINLSAELFNQDFDFTQIKKLITKEGVVPSKLGFEITETAILKDQKSASRAMAFLKSEGFLFALDDFGTGYSNLSQLQTQDFAKVKFDKSLIMSSRDDKKMLKLLEMFIGYFNAFGCTTVIEGVESAEQFELLLHLGCKEFQGYFFSRPLPPEDLENHQKTAAEEISG